jgi:hypothetical protein
LCQTHRDDRGTIEKRCQDSNRRERWVIDADQRSQGLCEGDHEQSSDQQNGPQEARYGGRCRAPLFGCLRLAVEGKRRGGNAIGHQNNAEHLSRAAEDL